MESRICSRHLSAFLNQSQARGKLDCAYWFPPAYFFQSVLTDSSTHEFPLWNLGDPRQLRVGRYDVSFSSVFDTLEIQQAQIFALFPMPVVLFSDVDWRPVRDDVRSLQQSACVELARLAIRPQALCFGMALVGVEQHEEILWNDSATVVFVSEFVNTRFVIVDVDALRAHPLNALG